MTALPALRSRTALAIDAALEAMPAEDLSPVLRCSGLGESCDRRLWYGFRWAHEPERFKGRIRRIFANGHDREARIVEMLKSAGMQVQEIDPATGRQWRVELIDGVLAGSCDGIVTGVPESPATPHLLEIKTMNRERWDAWRRKGVRVSDPKYFVQVQLYMHGLRLDRALFVAENQDSKDIEVERIPYDAAFAIAQVERARRIAFSEIAPPRVSDSPDWYECRFCPARAICHDGGSAGRNCRTCLASTLTEGGWGCARHGVDLSEHAQRQGCPVHLYLPALVAGEQVDADEAAGTVTYRLADGSTWVDGVREHAQEESREG